MQKLSLDNDRQILEMGEARTLAHNFKDKEWLDMALKVSEKYYGKGSGVRIKSYMRGIWRTEMCK